MYEFIYDVPTKIYFGDKLNCLGDEIKQFGNKVLVVYGGGSVKKSGLLYRAISQISEVGLQFFELGGVQPNPRISLVREGVKICKNQKITVILAIGGGSAIDTAKAVAAGARVDFDAWEFYSKQTSVAEALPIVAILTNAATGSEMNVNSVISNPETNDKIGIKSRHILPRAAFLDPRTTFSLNAYQTACGAVDIISHIFEVYFTTKPDLQMLDGIMESLIKTVIKFAPVAIKNPDDYEARANLMWASTWALNSFIRGGKQQAWTCHPIEHELSAIYDITHGLGLAILTPRWLRYCLNQTTLPRIATYGVNVFGIDKTLSQSQIAEAAIQRTEEFFFGILGLKSSFYELGITDEHFETMSNKAAKGGLIKGFIDLGAADIENILKMCL